MCTLSDWWIIQGDWAIMREAMRDKLGLRAHLTRPDAMYNQSVWVYSDLIG